MGVFLKTAQEAAVLPCNGLWKFWKAARVKYEEGLACMSGACTTASLGLGHLPNIEKLFPIASLLEAWQQHSGAHDHWPFGLFVYVGSRLVTKQNEL